MLHPSPFLKQGSARAVTEVENGGKQRGGVVLKQAMGEGTRRRETLDKLHI